MDAGKSGTLSGSLRKKTVERRSPPCWGYRNLVHAQDCCINPSLVMKKKSNFKMARKVMFSITLSILARNWEISEYCTMEEEFNELGILDWTKNCVWKPWGVNAHSIMVGGKKTSATLPNIMETGWASSFLSQWALLASGSYRKRKDQFSLRVCPWGSLPCSSSKPNIQEYISSLNWTPWLFVFISLFFNDIKSGEQKSGMDLGRVEEDVNMIKVQCVKFLKN